MSSKLLRNLVSQIYDLKDLRAEKRLHILRHVREICKREPCGDVWQEVSDIQWGESHLPPMGALLCIPEDVTACCAFGLSDASLRRSSLRTEYDTSAADDRRMVSSGGNFTGVIPEHAWGLEFWQCVLVTEPDWTKQYKIGQGPKPTQDNNSLQGTPSRQRK